MSAAGGGPVSSPLPDIAAANRRGEAVALTSVCSADRIVLDTALRRAAAHEAIVCIESTCNQVNQDGGYTGMTAARFRDEVASLAAAAGLPSGHLILGGDHLGPYPWRERPAAEAMAAARELVRSCVAAGYSKLHLDTSMRCADDGGRKGEPLPQETATARAADLCRAAEDAHSALTDGAPAPAYVVGTEVPAPGGETSASGRPAVTPARDAERVLDMTREAFAAARVDAAWERVVAIVVQPGVEFGDQTVIDYDRDAAAGLGDALRARPGIVFEAHSTDYQRPQALRALVEDHFGILKVGPWLTFALREAVFALEAIEGELLGSRRAPLSGVRAALEAAMLAQPGYWRPYYAGDDESTRLARAFSYSDRCRYYWPQPPVRRAVDTLLGNLRSRPIPPALLSQYLPGEYEQVRDGRLGTDPAALMRAHIERVLDVYGAACGES
ncbi:MAG TPA: class II D-tagatose-bisphosphate aldolase, non-catalytic subunit [Thermoleophilia bacterium]|nr:class II D-tagatose-bisphosphate aldolase, non-catalytic subunit [Thermoleophilia bacterium]